MAWLAGVVLVGSLVVPPVGCLRLDDYERYVAAKRAGDQATMSRLVGEVCFDLTQRTWTVLRIDNGRALVRSPTGRKSSSLLYVPADDLPMR